MVAYAVKHLVDEHGPLSKIMKSVKKTPYSFTSKQHEADDAARGKDVYVIEVRNDGKRRSYWMGYRYKATRVFQPAGGGLWNGFKNSATPGEAAEGMYFESSQRARISEISDESAKSG